MTERYHYLDILKGLGIFFVVFGHITHIPWLRTYIWGFHMPLFFFISGILFDRTRYLSFMDLVKRRVNNLVSPYILFSVIGLIWWSLSAKYKTKIDDSTWIEQFLGIFYGNMNGAVGALWFLATLFSMECIFYWVSFISSKRYLFVVVLLMHVLGMFSIYSPWKDLPWGINLAFIAIPFMGFGYISREMLEVIRKRNPLVFFILGLSCAIFSILLLPFTGFDLSMHHFVNYYGYIPIGLLGILTYLMFSLIIKRNVILEWMGKNTIVVIALHGAVYCILLYFFSKIFSIPIEYMRENALWCLIVTVLNFISLIPIISLYNKYIRPNIKVFKRV